MSEALYTQEQLIRTRNENYNAGIQDERERIIKLLKEQTDHACPDCLDRAINDAIALIKGENK